MNKPNGNLINVIATGIIVLVLFSLALFWGRLFCNFTLIKNMPERSLRIIIRPSGLVAGEPYPQQVEPEYRAQSSPPGPNEPNVRYSQVYASIRPEVGPIKAIGVFWDILAETAPYRDVNEKVYYWFRDKDKYIYLDKRSGLIKRRYILGRSESNDEGILGQEELFAGPNGVSRTADLSLGRFHNLLVAGMWWTDPNRMGLYDKITRQFYMIDFVEGKVSKGLQLAEGDSREPIAIGRIEKNVENPESISWTAPETWKSAEDTNAGLAEQGGGVPFGKWEQQKAILAGNSQSSEGYVYRGSLDWSYTFIPVLDKTGRIYIYNSKEQSLTQCGYVPAPHSFFNLNQQNETANLRDVLDYQIWPVYAVLRASSALKKPGRIIDVKYLGMCVASISREGTSMTAAVFDPNGELVYRGDTKTRDGVSSAEAVYDEAPGSSFWTAVEFILENLQPVTFELASYFCGYRIEAAAGHRALFILPNSFVGMMGRHPNEGLFRKPIQALMLMGPSLILSVWLALRVRKDAVLTGLSGTAKKWWTIGTIAFGLSAYITYRLTRPKEMLVSCQNCGKMRRPDMETCHRCGSKWDIPEITPPNWRIKD